MRCNPRWIYGHSERKEKRSDSSVKVRTWNSRNFDEWGAGLAESNLVKRKRALFG